MAVTSVPELGYNPVVELEIELRGKLLTPFYFSFKCYRQEPQNSGWYRAMGKAKKIISKYEVCKKSSRTTIKKALLLKIKQ